MESWSRGVVELWSHGVMESWIQEVRGARRTQACCNGRRGALAASPFTGGSGPEGARTDEQGTGSYLVAQRLCLRPRERGA
eukprot:7524429-Pyramimonas_sp.AAC.1